MLRLVLLVTCLSSINAAYFKVISGRSSKYGTKGNDGKPAECLEQTRTNGDKSNSFGNDIAVQCCKDVKNVLGNQVHIGRFFTPEQAKGLPECIQGGYRSNATKLCCRAVNYDTAKDLCKSRELRLCTFDEANDATIQNLRFDKSGCDFDAYHIWTSTPCEPELPKCCNGCADDIIIYVDTPMGCSLPGWTQSCSECGISVDSGRIKFQSQFTQVEDIYVERVFTVAELANVRVSYNMTSIRLEKEHGDYIYMKYKCDGGDFIEEKLVDGIKDERTINKVLDLSDKKCNELTIRFGIHAKGGNDDLAWLNCPIKIIYNKYDTELKKLEKKIDDLERNCCNGNDAAAVRVLVTGNDDTGNDTAGVAIDR